MIYFFVFRISEANTKNILTNLAARIATDDHLTQLKSSIVKLNLAGYNITINQYDSVIEDNIDWAEKTGSVINKWLIDNKYDGSDGGEGGSATSIFASIFLLILSFIISHLNFFNII